MPTVTGTVEGIYKKESGWYDIKVSGRKLETKKAELVKDLSKGMTISAEYTEKVNGSYTNLYLDKWTPAEANERTQAESSRQDSFEAKDRAIAMESAYSSAARFLAHKADAGPGELQEIARLIYADIQTARNGESFDA